MAGIGFELRKVASLGNARGIFQASLSGIMIVAGPWLISILTILMFQQPVMGIPAEFRQLFTASTVYIYATSLVINGGFHYIFTRILSDYLYRNENPKAFAYTVQYMLKSNIVFIPLAFGMVQLFFHNISVLHKAGFIILFVTINHIWILMLTASAMKRFNQLLLGYIIGMSSSLILMKMAMMFVSSEALLLAYATGQVILFLIVLFYLRGDMGYDKVTRKGDFLKYSRRYYYLFFTGFVYYGALWADKFIYWYLRGEAIGFTSLRLYPEYDVIVYLTNLMMIPGMVFFVIYSETEFFVSLKKFLDSMSNKPYHEIQANQRILVRANRKILKEQIGLQAIFTLLFITWSLNDPNLSQQLRIIFPTALSIMVLGLYVCIMNFLFYVEQYRQVLISCLIFFLTNVLLAWYGEGGDWITPGISSLAGILLATLTAGLFLNHALQNLDRTIYTAITKGRLREIREAHQKLAQKSL
ncbi:MAG: exopolysaccharide Pel transporter PelG [Spirochaetales bacterium]|nr:exopolysaccharide Pel transporter PelG [Spirochaetales bacterium]